MLISADYARLNAELHAADPGYGTSATGYVDLVIKPVADRIKTTDLLDYGCGKRTLEAALGYPIQNYDPGIPGLDGRPKPATLVVSTDVLEHIEPDCLPAVLDDLKALTKRVVLLIVATGPADKALPDGRNAHLIQQRLEWWLPQLEARWRAIRYWDTDTGFCFIGQNPQDRLEPPNLNDIGPPLTQTVVSCKSIYNDEQRCENIRSAMLRGKPTIPIMPVHDKLAVLACYGPSLAATVEDLRETVSGGGDLYTVSGAHSFLIECGIIPKGHIESDPRPHKAKCIGTADKRVVYFLASACDRAAFDLVQGCETWVYHVTSSARESNLIAAIDNPGTFTVDGGTNVGMSAIGLLTALGYRRFAIYGMDCSFEVDERLLHWPANADFPPDLRATARFHAGAHPNEDQDIYRVWIDGRPFITSPQMLQGAQDMAALITQKPHLSITLNGDGFLPALMAHITADKKKAKAA